MTDTPLEAEIHRSNRMLRLMICIGLLALTLGAAAYLRLVGLDWDENQHLHPDERFLTLVTSALSPQTAPTTTLAQYFDTETSTLNPNNVGFGFFVYGDFPVILTRYVGGMLNQTDYFSIYLVGRVLSALADLGVLLLIFAIAVELFDWRVGLIASGLYGATAFSIQQSHFFTVDTVTNLFVVASFLFIARTVKRHRWLDFVLFGVTFGLAVASKVSVFPLAVILALVVATRAITSRPVYTHAQDASDQVPTTLSFANLNIRRALIGLIIAGVLSIATFRVTQPYAFLPAGSGVQAEAGSGALQLIVSKLLDPVGFQLNPLWLDQMSQVRGQVSGYSDIPPNHQWGKRLPLVFPWVNMVRIGFGWPLGILCWLAFAWAIWEVVRRNASAPTLLPLVLWVGLFFGWQGIGWVTTMRYFLPVYPFLILLAGWALVTAWDRVQALLAARGHSRWHWSSRTVLGLGIFVFVAAYAWGFAVSRIYTRPVTRIAATRWVFDNVPSDATLLLDTLDGQRQINIGFYNNYPLSSTNTEPEDPTQPVVRHTRLTGGMATAMDFTALANGTLTAIRLNHVLDVTGAAERTLHAAISADPAGDTILAEGEITRSFEAGDDPRGYSATIEIPPLGVQADQTYYLVLRPDPGAPLDLFSATIATEGAWDDPVPLSMAPYVVWDAQYQGYEMEMAWEDIPEKRDRMQYILDNSDYLTISSNRFYASLSRNPERFPMSIAYYKALFSGELGFDLVADFTSRPNLGPIQFYDDDAEEAWTVYDHPRVMIFKKSARYDPEKVAEVLNSADLTKVVKLIAKDAKGSPVTIPLPTLGGSTTSAGSLVPASSSPAVALANFYRSNQVLAVILWWIVISLIGWAVFPILYSVFPGLPDRGYPFSRVFGLLLAGWLAWLIASLHLVPWAAWSILIVLILLAGACAVLVITRQRDLLEWVILQRRHLIFVELLMLALFLFFLLVRLGNPDLWHPSFGGEKPMDMAYFTAVLKSRFFPPYDPWFEGGTINYYYFGFVIVGLPVKLLGLPVTLAYNLILPLLFAITGIGAFSVVFNLIGLRGIRQTVHPPAPSARPGLLDLLKAWPHISTADLRAAIQQTAGGEVDQDTGWLPYVAGVGAMLLVTILGNLDEIRTLIWAAAELGSGQQQWANSPFPALADIVKGFQMSLGQGQPLPVGLGEWYWNATRLIPVPIVNGIPTENGPITEFPYFTFLYADLHAHMIAMPITLMALVWCVAQIGSVINPQANRATLRLILNILLGALIVGALRPANTWDWPTYLALAGLTLVITHFYRRDDSSALPALATGGIGALLVGGLAYLFLASSTPNGQPSGSTALIVAAGAAGFGLLVGFAVGLAVLNPPSQPGDEERNLIRPWLTLFGGIFLTACLAGLTMVLFLPYILTYKLAYTSLWLWEGSRTPLWAYLDILGLFLFIIVSWMTSESLDWVKRLRQAGRLSRRQSMNGIFIGAGVIAIIVVAIINRFAVAAIGLPIMLWAVILFCRHDLPVEKRIMLALLVTAILLSMLVEVVVLQGDLSRMNTVFKFYVQVWILMGIVAGAALGWLWPALSGLPKAPRTLWLIWLGLLVFLAALYPLMATRAKIADRWSSAAPHTLDGMSFMPYVQHGENGVYFSLKPDYDALRWMQDHIEGTPVVLETHTTEYLWGNRVTVYTGFPAIIGWNWHQRQQRPLQDGEVWTRVAAIEEIYNTLQLDRALALMDQYRVELIIVGDLERAYYGPVGLAKFRTLADEGKLTLLYDHENTQIYQVVRPGHD